MSRNRILSSSRGARQMGMLAAGDLAERLPGLDGDLAIGFRRQTQNDLGRIDVAVDPRPTLTGARRRDRAIELLQEGRLALGVPADALAAIAERSPSAGPAR